MNRVHKHKVLMIDDAFLLEVNNLNRKVNQAIKHPEPVLRLDAPWDAPNDMIDFISVVYDEYDERFKMWYTVVSCPSRDDYLYVAPTKLAYASSADGIHWDRPVLNMVEHNGSRENNYVTPQMGLFGHSIILDPSDPHCRRFKMLFLADSGYGSGRETDWAKFHVPLCLGYSHDGITWDRPVHVNPVIRGVSDGPFTLFYDQTRRKYVLFSRRVPNLPRDVSQYESYDLVNWEDKGRVIVAGDQYDPPDTYNLHAISICCYEDFYLGMLNTMYVLPESETYEVFNRPPPDYPNQRLGTLDLQLAYSRDGQTWSRPADRSPVVPVGEGGSPDGGFIFPANNPVVRDGETWIYYTGRVYRHNDWDRRSRSETVLPRDEAFAMLAKMPEDQWVSLDAGNTEGWVLTKPFVPPAQLLVNADAKGGHVAAECVTPYGTPVEGLTRADCIPVTGNGKDQQIKWKSGVCPRDLLDQHRGGLCLKFYLKNAKLYSYTIVEPDPDGAIARYWANARWNEVIMHRSGNWDRTSNEPAGGLPQPPGTQHGSGTRFGPNPRAQAKWS